MKWSVPETLGRHSPDEDNILSGHTKCRNRARGRYDLYRERKAILAGRGSLRVTAQRMVSSGIPLRRLKFIVGRLVHHARRIQRMSRFTRHLKKLGPVALALVSDAILTVYRKRRAILF